MNFRNTISKSQQPEKTSFSTYLPHSTTVPTNIKERKWSEDYYQVASIDPALKNCALRIERRYHSGKIITLVYEKTQFLAKSEETVPLNPIYSRVNNFLDIHLKELLCCHIVIMERQLPQNYKAVRVSQCILSYLLIKLKDAPLLPTIIEVDPKLKSRPSLLNCPKGLNEKQIKQWSVERAKELLKDRQDHNGLAILEKVKKADDLADTLCQTEAFFAYIGLPLTKKMQEEVKGRLRILTSTDKQVEEQKGKTNEPKLEINSKIKIETRNIPQPPPPIEEKKKRTKKIPAKVEKELEEKLAVLKDPSKGK